MVPDYIIENYNNSLIYDGDCPFCSKFVELIDLKKAVPDLRLINAREHPELVKTLHNNNYNLNVGMVFIFNNNIYHKDKSVTLLAILANKSDKKDLFNKLIYLSFKNKYSAKIIYPILRAGRRVWLFIAGISLIK